MNRENIIKHFRCPSGRSEAGKAEWDKRLREGLDWDCDWLEHLNDHMNPWPAQAVEELCDRAEKLEADLENEQCDSEFERERAIKAEAEVVSLKADLEGLVEAVDKMMHYPEDGMHRDAVRKALAAVKEKP
jgi:hypothetical protein